MLWIAGARAMDHHGMLRRELSVTALATTRFRRVVASLLIASTLSLTSGCATLAHRSSFSASDRHSGTACGGGGEVCPWLIGDALLLFAGVIPGVIAFAVDFGTGCWRHPDGGEARTVRYDDEARTSGG